MLGIYKISSKISKQVYIGSTRNIAKRWWYHIKELTNNKHHNYKLQKDFDDLGITNFRFEVLESFEKHHNMTTEDLESVEQEWMDKFSDLYNIYDTVKRPIKPKKKNKGKKKRKKAKKERLKLEVKNQRLNGLSLRDRKLQERYDALKA